MALQPDGGTGQGVLTLAGWAGLAGQAGLAGLGWAGWGEISDLMGSRRMYLDPSGSCYLLHGSSILRKSHVFMISGSSYLLRKIAIWPPGSCYLLGNIAISLVVFCWVPLWGLWHYFQCFLMALGVILELLWSLVDILGGPWGTLGCPGQPLWGTGGFVACPLWPLGCTFGAPGAP